MQDAGGEAYLVGGGVVVGVDGLRVHIPLVAVNRLLVFLLHSLAVGPFAHILHRLVERLASVDVELGVVSPFVGVANLDIEGGELVLGVGLGLGAHPFLRVDALGQGYLQVLHQLLHASLVLCGEVFLHVELSHSLTQYGVDGRYAAFPACLGLLLARHGAVVEIEVLHVDLVAQHIGVAVDEGPLHPVLQRLQVCLV